MRIISRFKNETGLTLVEVLVSTVLLVIILSIFLSVFSQSATMNRASEEIITATYVAQKEMEYIYASSSYLNIEDAFPTTDYYERPEIIVEEKTWQVYEKINSENNFFTRVRIRENDNYNSLVDVIVEVYEGEIRADSSNLQAKMQNIIEWGPAE